MFLGRVSSKNIILNKKKIGDSKEAVGNIFHHQNKN